jgi:hypothetical protein
MMGLGMRAVVKFDRTIIKTRWKHIAESPAKKAGLKVRRVAINSIRRDRTKSGNTPSRPGKPPRTRAPGDPMRRIYSVPDLMGTRVIVGPVGFGDPRPVTELHEFGGVRTGLFRRQRHGVPRRRGGRFAKENMVFERATVRFPARPTMGPALDKVRPSLPLFWRGSFH